jgi:hypothetical protein
LSVGAHYFELPGTPHKKTSTDVHNSAPQPTPN